MYYSPAIGISKSRLHYDSDHCGGSYRHVVDTEGDTRLGQGTSNLTKPAEPFMSLFLVPIHHACRASYIPYVALVFQVHPEFVKY